MKYYKLSMDMERENDIVCHYQNDYGIIKERNNEEDFKQYYIANIIKVVDALC